MLQAHQPRPPSATRGLPRPVTQYLAGIPEMLARYRNAPPAAQALIHVAIDARLLGHGLTRPHALLEAAAAPTSPTP